MNTIILPGFSNKNKEWVSATVKDLSFQFEVDGINWQHWTEEIKNNWRELEVQRILEKIGNQKVNIIAKSIGTSILMSILKMKPHQINKIILCGIALNDFTNEDKKNFSILQNLPTKNILCIQNFSDKHGSYNEVKHFLKLINPNIKIVSKPRSDHHYPYSSDFIKFLL